MRSHRDPESARIKELAAGSDRFSAFSSDDLDQVIASARHLTVPEHWALMMEQTPADKAYLIIDGTASVRHGGEEVATIGPGEFIGEMALVNRSLRTATVVAASPLEVLHFTADDIASLRASLPAFDQLISTTADERRG